MTAADREARLQATERHLALALAWLRDALQRLAPPLELAGVVPPRRGLLRLSLRHATPLPVLPPASVTPPKPDALREIEAGDPAPALVTIGRSLELTEFERDLLLFALSPMLDPGIRDLCGRAAGDPRLGFPTPALAMRALPGAGWDPLLPTRPLRRLGLVAMEDAAGQLEMSGEMRAAERVLHLLKGRDEPDHRLLALAVPEEGGPLAPSQQRRATEIGVAGGVPLLVGADPATRRAMAAALARGTLLLRLAAGRVPADVDPLARLVEREARLTPLTLLLDFAEGEPPAAALELARRLDGPMLIAAPQQLPPLDDVVTWDVARPSVAEQSALWETALGDAALGAELGSAFDLDAGTILALGAAAREAAGEDAAALRARARQAALAAARPALDRLAQRVETGATLDDLVLPERTRRVLEAIRDQVVHRATVLETWGFARQGPRGLGVSALFAGESGTGKTMAAEALARTLELPLLRIDLATTVSKYIGETEKNLKALFDAAERGGAVLFFDEADALFGRRSEVKDAHDRYANIEIDYLLQRMEAYRGLAILATNMKGALDPAFLRRLRFVVEFAYPGQADRRVLWDRAFPGELGAELDHDALAQLNLTGGSIRNVALNAAYAAAAAGAARVSMEHVREAARMEFAKLDRPMADIGRHPRLKEATR